MLPEVGRDRREKPRWGLAPIDALRGALIASHPVICRTTKGLRNGLSLCAVAALAMGSMGCGMVYGVKALSASSSLEEAKTLNADELAEYEYYYAEAMLEKASEEAAEANYGDAIEFADLASEYAEKAVELSKDAHRGAGR